MSQTHDDNRPSRAKRRADQGTPGERHSPAGANAGGDFHANPAPMEQGGADVEPTPMDAAASGAHASELGEDEDDMAEVIEQLDDEEA